MDRFYVAFLWILIFCFMWIITQKCIVTAVEVFRETDADYLNEEKGQLKEAGSTASTALLLGDRLFVANVGDSRVVACRAGSGCCIFC